MLPLGAVVALAAIGSLTDPDSQPAPSPASGYSAPTTAATLPAATTVPPTTIEKVKVPRLVGMKVDRAKNSLADRELDWTIKYKSTARYPAGTVISQSRKAGVGVLRDTTITLVIAKAPPPPPSTAPPPTAPPRNCHLSYPDDCIPPPPPDLDCPDIRAMLGHGNITVDHAYGDPHGLDGNDNDGLGCE